MTKSEKLIKRVKKECNLDLPADVIIVRTYAGCEMKCHGAFSWLFHSKTDPLWNNHGSTESVTALLKYKQLTYDTTWGDIDICEEERKINV